MSNTPSQRSGFNTFGLVADTDDMCDCLRAVLRDDAACVRVLNDQGRQRLGEAAELLAFRRARPVVGEGERAVTQDFEICDTVPHDTAFWSLTAALEGLVNEALTRLSPPPCPPVAFNDLVVQRYQPSACGISPHRDHVRYIHLIGLLVVYGAGRFYTCPDRSGAHAREVPIPEGSLLLMRAPGYGGRRDRPFHMLGEVTRERLILGIRQDSRQIIPE